MHSRRGFTLTELLVCCAIIAVLSSVAGPRLLNQFRSQEALAFGRLSGEIALARFKAFTQRTDVVLCGSSSATACDNNWNEGILLFFDQNNNRTFDSPDQPILYRRVGASHGIISWRGAGNHSVITFQGSSGYTPGYNGTLLYCGAAPAFHRTLVVSSIGEARDGADRNANGIVEDSSGRDITSC